MIPEPEFDAFALRSLPDGVYRIERRMIPVRDNSAVSNDDRKPVVAVHSGYDVTVGLLGCENRMDVEQRELELPVRP